MMRQWLCSSLRGGAGRKSSGGSSARRGGRGGRGVWPSLPSLQCALLLAIAVAHAIGPVEPLDCR